MAVHSGEATGVRGKLSPCSQKNTAYRTDLFYRAVWDENGYTTIITQAQLRHKSEQTTMRYDQTPVEDRRDALDRMR
ncbi:hypothetical protein BRD01_06770 [Halobacteriales archaeon QS_8_65_32]|nr:MAG: hypothetical protein BRD01_06770 [Halobacteriales archaeon QS_8_65_32]